MKSRSITCVQLGDVFQDFERGGLSMSWVYGNIGQIMRNSEIRVYGTCTDMHQKVDTHGLKDALSVEDKNDAAYVISLLGSCLIKNGIKDRQNILEFLNDTRGTLDNPEHFHFVYDSKELTADALIPYIIPSSVTDYVKPHEWKSCSLLRNFAQSEAKAFARENRLCRLHDFTDLHVDLAELQIEIGRVPDLLGLVKIKHDSEIQTSRATFNLEAPATDIGETKNKGGRPRKAFWDDFWIEFFGRVNDGDLKPRSEADVKEAMIQILQDYNWQLDDRELNEPSRKAWARIEPETKRIHNVNAEEN